MDRSRPCGILGGGGSLLERKGEEPHGSVFRRNNEAQAKAV